MSLREFEYIDESIEILKEITPTINMLSEELIVYFENILTVAMVANNFGHIRTALFIFFGIDQIAVFIKLHYIVKTVGITGRAYGNKACDNNPRL